MTFTLLSRRTLTCYWGIRLILCVIFFLASSFLFHSVINYLACSGVEAQDMNSGAGRRKICFQNVYCS